jgi:hypothetical protein
LNDDDVGNFYLFKPTKFTKPGIPFIDPGVSFEIEWLIRGGSAIEIILCKDGFELVPLCMKKRTDFLSISTNPAEGVVCINKIKEILNCLYSVSIRDSCDITRGRCIKFVDLAFCFFFRELISIIIVFTRRDSNKCDQCG